MYRMIVRSIAKKAYRHLSEGNYEAVLASFSPDAVFRFSGNHALGGELQGIELIRQWFQRVFRLFPDFRFEPQAVVVSGPPWNTMVATRFFVRATLPGGQPYTNEGVQFLRLRWGRAVEDRLYEDLQILVSALEAIAASGVPEAAAPPLGPVAAGAARAMS